MNIKKAAEMFDLSVDLHYAIMNVLVSYHLFTVTKAVIEIILRMI